MCGIVGKVMFSEKSEASTIEFENALKALSKRGPDFQQFVQLGNHNQVTLGHARLSILDTSSSAHQPMQSQCGNYTIVFNGEIYNFKTLKANLEKDGISFYTNSDTEVILEMYRKYGSACVKQFNGFFAFAIFNHTDQSIFIARDRIGIKPFYYRKTDTSFLFASEMKALMAFDFKKKIDFTSLQMYFQFNYIPAPHSIFEDVKKLMPGHCLMILSDGSFQEEVYYEIPNPKTYFATTYEQAQKDLIKHLETSVERRMVADVPLGSFLSGGIDSSVVATLATNLKPDLNTFSIGFKDNPYFDETEYANLVAKKIGSNHTVFSLTNNDLFEHLNDILDYTDEPFADSSAIPVFILSKKTREKVTVALSGDGADEMFGGYNKHFAEFNARKNNLKNKLVAAGAPLWGLLPKSRHSKVGNLFRQIDRFAQGYKLSAGERYWRWCAFAPEAYPKQLIQQKHLPPNMAYLERKADTLKYFTESGDLNETLYADMHQVLVNDMLTKVDTMSMANSLEVRVPFLDHEVVNFAFQLPPEFKVNNNGRKTILKDAFRPYLPSEIYNRNKMGFEVPLLQWFQTDLKELILNELLSDELIIEQDIFNLETIKALKKQLFSANPGEVHAQIWALIVFQHWWIRNMK